MTRTNIEIVEFEDIKELINSNSKKYNNFKDFSVVNNFEDKYIVYLNFYDEDIENKQDYIQVEVIRNVLHREIENVIKNAEKDFDNFIGIDIIENIEKENYVDVILKYNVDKSLNTFNLAHLKRWTSGHDTRTNVSDISFKITNYDPTDMYNLVGNSRIDKELYIESNQGKMLVSLFDPNKSILLGRDNKGVKEILYFIKYEADNAKYIISIYNEQSSENWYDKRVVTEEITLDYIDILNYLMNNIICFLEEKFNVIIDNKSKKNLKTELETRFSIKKENNEKQLIEL